MPYFNTKLIIVRGGDVVNSQSGTPEVEQLNNDFSSRRSIAGKVAIVVTIVAITMSIFHLYTSAFGVLLSLKQRSIHVGFALVLCWFLYAVKRSKKDESIPMYDWVLIFLTVITFSYISFTAASISQRMSYITPLSTTQIIIGTFAIFLLIEACRRTIGKAFVIILLTCLLYVYIGPYLNLSLSHKGFSYMWTIDHLVFTTNGIFGISTGVSATYIFIFILFGSFLHKTGAGDKLIQLAFALMGTQRGGPAKTGVVASGFFGMITGSAVSNVVTTGTFTIPMMKKIGYKPYFAGAVEAVASSGGQITPPLMGATAFLIAEFTGISYLEVAAAAIIPAVLYYYGVLLQVHLRALKENIMGIPKDQLPKKLPSLIDSAPYMLSVVAIVGFLLRGNTPLKAGLYAIIFIVLINLIISVIRSLPPISFKQIIEALDSGARTAVEVALICAASGIVVGVLTLTGIGLRISSIILDLSGGVLFITLLITMVTSIILGMGLPTVGAYIIQVALTVPALVQSGVPPLAAHLFIFYFGALSAITPPVAVAAYAAAGIAGSNPMKTGFMAFQLAIAGFIIPFMFVYGPSLILIGSSVDTFINTIGALIGVFALAAGVEGWLYNKTNWIERVCLIIGAFFLISPDLFLDVIGFILLLVAIILQRLKRSKQNEFIRTSV